ncbi:MAG: hypothetical protein DRP00_03460 [Candidatus Aenigmatarchaeota archaeon]|nr:MAG: hypothetical protein DRP00_03460 [Candidatus Aenigmarchaeota archaeon]
MQKALQMGKTSAVGSFKLFIGIVSSTIIMAIGTIILARLMTPEEYGLYSVALIPSYTFILLRDWGINSAIIKYVASSREQKREDQIPQLIAAGFLFKIIIGLGLSIILAVFSFFVASNVFNRPEASSFIAITSITIIAGALLTTSQSAFIGFERMEFYSLTSICQAFFKTLTSILLVLMGLSVLGAVLGYTISYIIGGLIGVVILYVALLRKIKPKSLHRSSLTKTLKKMLHYGAPLSMTNIILGLLQQFYAFLMAIYCTDRLIGNFKVASQFATILTFFTFPISTVLFPVFSKINPHNERKLLQMIFTSSVKYATMILVPITLMVMALSKPIVSTLFGEKWTYAPLYLTLYIVNYLFVMLGSLTLSNLLAGIGETKMQLKLSLITLTIGIPLSLVLIPSMGIIGLILTITVADKPSLLIGLNWTRKKYKIKIDIKSSIRIGAASALGAIVTVITINYFIMWAEWMRFTLGTLAFIITYLLAAPTIGAINKSDINNLKTMFSELGVISKLINIPLNFMEKLPNLK